MSDVKKPTTPKKAAKPAAPRKPAAHPKYSEMIVAAVTAIKGRKNGGAVSRQAIAKYIQANYTVGTNVDSQVKLNLKRMVANKALLHHKVCHCEV